jgi:hypothetical protein
MYIDLSIFFFVYRERLEALVLEKKRLEDEIERKRIIDEIAEIQRLKDEFERYVSMYLYTYS